MENVDILIEHGIVLTLNKDRHIITDGAVAIRKDRIVAVGKTSDLRNGSKAPRQSTHRCGWSCRAWSMAMPILARSPAASFRIRCAPATG